MAKRKKRKSKGYNPRTQKKIQHLSRAINKIDPVLKESTKGMSIMIDDVKAGINTVTFERNGIEQKIRYDQIESLSEADQSALLKKLSVDRYNLRQERALQQLQEKGKISWQFKRSLEQDNPQLLKSIEEVGETFEGSRAEALQEEFSKIGLVTGDDWEFEADMFFQSGKGTPELFDFFRPGEAGGFSELNIFTWNSYKVMRGV